MDTLRDTLVIQYMPLAKKLAYQKKKILPKFVDIDDLISAAYLGLCQSASRFDASQNVSFPTFAYPRILGAIHDYLRVQGRHKCEQSGVDFDVVYKESNYNEMLEVISQGIDDRAKNILREYFVDNYSMRDIGERIGITEGRVSQILKVCMDRIGKIHTKQDLSDLLAA